jgi:Do/DeqQ family serine protease
MVKHVFRNVLRSAAFGIAFVLTVGNAHAQVRLAPQSRADVIASFSPVVKLAAPAVVNVYAARREQRSRNPFKDDPFFERFFGGQQGGGFGQERSQQSVGSGVIVSADGIIVTNHHVVEGMTELKVSLADKREFEAQIMLRDPRTDLAVLKIKSTDKFTALPLGESDGLEVGDIVLAIGNPFGVGQTVTQGIVSALARTHVGVSDYQFFIQTDAAINPGNSGGALVDMQGRLVGINTAIFSQSGGSHGIGFAIPVAMVKTVIEGARTGGSTIRRPWFGARLQPIANDMVESLGLNRPTGALVASVVDKSPAAEAGLKRNDVIVGIDSQTVDDPESFGYRFATKSLNGVASLAVMRSGKRLVLPVKLISAPESRPRDAVVIKARGPLAGVTVVNVSPAVAEELSLETSNEGVVVSAVEEGSPAGLVGFQKGDMIVAINGEKADTTKRLDELAKERRYVWRVTINRGGEVFTSIFGG